MSLMLSVYTLPVEGKPRGDSLFHLSTCPDTIWTFLFDLGSTDSLHVLETNGGYPWKGVTTASTIETVMDEIFDAPWFLFQKHKYDRAALKATLDERSHILYTIEAWDNS